MNRKTGKSSFICPLLYNLILFAITIVLFAHGIASAAEVTLAWDANIEPDLAGYKIYYDTNSGAPYYGTDADQGISPITVLIEDLGDPDYPEFTLTGLLDDQDYYIALTAFNNEDAESGFSNEASTADGTSNDYNSSGGGSYGCFIGTAVNALCLGFAK